MMEVDGIINTNNNNYIEPMEVENVVINYVQPMEVENNVINNNNKIQQMEVENDEAANELSMAIQILSTTPSCIFTKKLQTETSRSTNCWRKSTTVTNR